MRMIAPSAMLAALIACGGTSERAVNASIGWSFQHRDWTKDTSAAPDDLRGCDNQPDTANGPQDLSIEQVRIFIEDPQGQRPGQDDTVECSRADEQAGYRIIGLVKQVFEMTIEAWDTSGDLRYRLGPQELDLSTTFEKVYQIPTVTGEYVFFPSFAGSVQCPMPVTTATLRTTITEANPEMGAAPIQVTHESSPCENDGLSAQTFVRAIPAMPEETQVGGYLPKEFHIKVDVWDGSNVLYCDEQQNVAIFPGTPTTAPATVDLAAGACP